jgi:exodeoxyribonuclease X
MKLLFLDTETTGNVPGQDRLCQVCYKNADGIVDELFKPPIPISIKSMSITHITNRMVEEKPPFQGSAAQQELQRLLQDHILVAHNALFDIAMLEAEELTVPQFICTLRVARHLDTEDKIPEYNLQYLRYYLEIDLPDAHAHDAKGDVLVLEAVFERLFEKMKALHNGDEHKALEQMMDVSTKPSLIRTITFGKYKGKKLEELVHIDPGYLEWLLGQKQSEAANGGNASAATDDWIYSLKHYLGRS